MQKRSIYVAVFGLLLALVLGATAFTRSARRPVKAQQAQSQILPRTQHGVMPPLASDLAGVALVGVELKTPDRGTNETAVVRIVNNTARGIDSFRLCPVAANPARAPLTSFFILMDARERPQPDGSDYKHDGNEPIIPAHGTKEVRIPLGNVADDTTLILTAIVWSDGTAGGRDSDELLYRRATIADRHGFHAELNELNQRAQP